MGGPLIEDELSRPDLTAVGVVFVRGRDWDPPVEPEADDDSPYDMVYAWGNNERRAELKGRRCRVIARGAKGTILIELDDGEKVTTSHNAVRPYNAESAPAEPARRRGRHEALPGQTVLS